MQLTVIHKTHSFLPFWHHIVCVVLQHVQQTITGNLAKENDVLQMNQFAFTGKPMAEGTFLLFFQCCYARTKMCRILLFLFLWMRVRECVHMNVENIRTEFKFHCSWAEHRQRRP